MLYHIPDSEAKLETKICPVAKGLNNIWKLVSIQLAFILQYVNTGCFRTVTYSYLLLEEEKYLGNLNKSEIAASEFSRKAKNLKSKR